MKFRALLLLLLTAHGVPAAAAEPASTATNPATSTSPIAAPAPQPVLSTNAIEAIRAMRIANGFRLQLAAAAPDVRSPVALAFDANGRLFVAEQPTDTALGRIKLLEDADGDGVFEKSGIFADNVPHPTALICYSSGVFVASGEQILFLADTTGKGTADVRREIFGGFETANAVMNYGGGINNFTWGPDNRIHAATVGVRGNIACLAIPSSRTLPLNDHNFAFDPRTLTLALEPDDASRGVSFDNAARRFVCTATHPAKLTLSDPIRAARNPRYIWPQLTVNISPDSADKLISSVLVYRGGALGSNAVNQVFYADTIKGAIRRQPLRENVPLPTLGHSPDGTLGDLLSSQSPAFRPIQIVSGPDGSLFVADLAREKLDSAGEDNGRIWRLSPAKFKSQKPPQLATFKSPELVALLGNPNGWMRDTAARLLYERADTNSIPLLSHQLTRAKEPLARLHSLRLLDSLSALTEADLLAALRDADETVREQAVLVTDHFIRDGDVSNALWSQLTVLPGDASPRVRYQAALTLAAIKRRNVAPVLADLARSAPGQELLQSAVLTAAGSCAAEVFQALVGDLRVRTANLGEQFLGELAWQTGAQNATGMDEVLTAIERAQSSADISLMLARRVGEGLASMGRTFRTAAPQGTWTGYGGRALDFALNGRNLEVRSEAIRFLGVAGYTTQEVGDWLLAYLVSGEPQQVQSAAIAALGPHQSPLITSAFIQRWPSLTRISQAEIISQLLTRPDRTVALLTALEQKRIPREALSDAQVNFLRHHREPGIAARATALFGAKSPTGLAERFAGVLQMRGLNGPGRDIFNARCASCHTPDDNGRTFGPDLARLTSDRPKILQDILEPDRDMRPEYRTTVVQRTDGELLFGLCSNPGADVVALRQPGGTVFIPRTRIENLDVQEWSLMPEDTVAGLPAARLADLLEYLAPTK